jgi:hypothetical protein
MNEPESRARLRLSNGRTEQSMVGVETVLDGAATVAYQRRRRKEGYARFVPNLESRSVTST